MNDGRAWTRERHAFELLEAMRSLMDTVVWFQTQLPNDFGNIDRIRLERARAAVTAYEAAIARDAPHPEPAGWQVAEPGHRP